MKKGDIKAGMLVDCLGERLGTVAGLRQDAAGPVLEVRTAGSQAAGSLLLIPARLVTQVLGNTVSLGISCADATRMGSSYSQSAGAAAVPAAPTSVTAGETLRVPVVEETLVPVTHWQEAGVVELHKTVHTVTQELDVPLRYEEATMERVPVNRVLAETDIPAPRQEGDTWIVPIVHEEVVVVKRRVLAEELRITKQVRTTTQHIAEQVRREEIDIAHPGLDARTVDTPDAPV